MRAKELKEVEAALLCPGEEMEESITERNWGEKS